MSSRLAARVAAQLGSVVVLFAAWLLLSEHLGAAVIPRPWSAVSSVCSSIADGSVTSPLLGSIARMLAAFALSMIIGTAYGIAAGRSELFHRYTVGLYTVIFFAPSLVVIFCGLLIFGFTSSFVVVLIATFCSFANVAVYIRDVARHIDDDLMLMVKSYNIGHRDRVIHVLLPYVTPALLSSSRIALNGCWKIVLLCEVFGFPGGIGFSLRNSFAVYNLPALFGWILLIACVLLILEQVIRLLEFALVRWR